MFPVQKKKQMVKRSKSKERKKEVAEYLDLAQALQQLWNMKVTAIPRVIEALGTIPEQSH